jgi:hypothetical protein
VRRGRASADDARGGCIGDGAAARPGAAIGEAQFDAGEIALLGEAHVDAQLDVAEFRDGAGGQDEVGGGAADGAEPDLGCGVRLVLAAVPGGCSFNADLGGVEVGPAGAGLAAERAVALVDEVGAFRRGDPNLAAEAGERQHGGVVSGVVMGR